MTGTKEEALAYLRSLKKSLASSGMPKGSAMDAEIKRIVTTAKKDEHQKHLRLPEAAFLNWYAIPVLCQHLHSEMGLSKSDAREAFLNEYHRTMPNSSVGSPIYPLRYPFRKSLGLSAHSIYREWLNPTKRDGLTQSAPDFALRQPFPHSIIFEGKYYASGSKEYGGRQLATDLYQACFYRGLPKTLARRKGGADWSYDYACLLAFDASKEGTLLGAWKALSPAVRKSFWESANIYVMILRE
jgi:hypothetical protein